MVLVNGYKKIIKSRRQSLLATFALGVVVFIDDYLNCLAVSTSVKKTHRRL
ncbi:Na+/H+ antiporter NhaC [Psychrobacter sp. JCM 18900]|nr:Na+/H+ antiporter NhaC [Psychrobacter sp. JCM 18900]